jgi:predicted dehydrogenase
MRIGLLGSGFMGKQHLAGYAALPGVEVVTRNSPGYSDLNPKDRETLQRRMIADPDLDAIDICLPTPLHAPVAIAALKAGKHVLCEKPMALSAEECSRMLLTAWHSERVLMIAHVLRFFRPYRILAEVLRSQRYGPPESIRFSRSSGIPAWADWLLQPEQSGGAVFDLLVHDFDQTITLFGLPPRAWVRTIEQEDAIDCIFDYGSGLTVEVAGGWYRDRRPFGMGFRARFAEAELVFEEDQLQVLRNFAPPETLHLSPVDPYAEELRYFVTSCRSHLEPLDCPPSASAQAVHLALAVQKIARTTPRTFCELTLE